MEVEDGGREVFMQYLGDPLSAYIAVAPGDTEELFPAVEVPEDEQVGVTPPDPTQSFELSSAATVDEGGTLTVTVTATEAVAEDTTFTYSLAGSGTNAATAADFSTATSGSVTILAGDTTGTFTVGAAKNDSAEFAEDFTVTLKSGTEVIDTLTATINDTSTSDNTAPVATAAVVHYNENATATTVLATVAATDATGVTGFEIVSGDSTTAPNFAIDATGKITFTTAGLTSTYNDADDTGTAALNTVTLGVKAVDAAGNKSETVNIQLDVDNVDDTPPTVQSAVITGNTVVVNFGESLDTASGSPLTTDFKVNVAQSGGTGVNNVTAILVGTNSVTLTLANPAATGQTFTLDYTPGTTPLQDAAGNDVVAFAGQAVKADTTAPVITAGQTTSYIEGTNDDIADIVYTVVATDADSSVASFSIDSGNTSGFYAIDNKGNITLTTAGLAGASNDFETTPNSFTLGVKATDAAGNSATENVTITVTNNTADDAAAPMELTLTNQTDALAGATGDDTFIGDHASVSAADVIDGNGGNDTARLTFIPAAATNSFILTSREVETFKVQNAATAQGAFFNSINTTELATLTNNNSTATLTVTNVGANPTFGITGGDADATEIDDFKVTFQSGYGTGTANIALDGARLDNLDLGNSFTSYKITTSGSSSSSINDFKVLTDVNADGDYDDAGDTAVDLTNLTTITFEGDKALSINLELENVTTFTATNNSGGVSVVIDDAKNVAFTGGTGNDSVNIQAAGLDSSDVLAGGTGTDTLIVNNIAGILTTTNSANIKEFETLNAVATGAGTLAGVQAAEAVTIDIDNIVTNNALTGVIVSGGSLRGIQDAGGDNDAFTDLADTITINNINSGAVNNITVILTDDTGDTATLADGGANTDTTTAQTDNLTFTGKGFLPGGTSETATLDFNNYGSGGASRDGGNTGGIDVNTLKFDNLDVLNIKSTGDAIPAAAEQGSIASLDASDAEKIVITGTQSFSLTTANSTNALTEVDASGLTGTTAGAYGLTLNTSASTSITSLLVKGTNDIDNINVSGEGTASSLITGAGNEVITIDEGSTSTMHFTTATRNTGDMLGGTTILVNGLLSPNDFRLNLASGVEAVLKSSSTVLGTNASDVNLISTIDSNTNVAFFDAVDGDADGVADDFEIRIYLNGDGAFPVGSTTDWKVVIVDGAATLTGVTYNAANDIFVLTGLAAVNGTSAGEALNGAATDDVITGNAGADTITGNAGVDRIHLGHDTVADRFVATAGAASVDLIYNFSAGGAATNDDIFAADATHAWFGDGVANNDGVVSLASALTIKAAKTADDDVTVITITTDAAANTFDNFIAGTTTEAAMEALVVTALGLTGACVATDIILVAVDDGEHTGLFKFTGADAATDDAVDVAEIEIMAILMGVTDASTIVAGDVLFA